MAARFFGFDVFANPAKDVNHGDELFMMFKPEMLPFDTVYTDDDKTVSKNVIKAWVNFATYGDPTPGL